MRTPGDQPTRDPCSVGGFLQPDEQPGAGGGDGGLGVGLHQALVETEISSTRQRSQYADDGNAQKEFLCAGVRNIFRMRLSQLLFALGLQ